MAEEPVPQAQVHGDLSWAPRGVRLLDADPDLGEDLSEQEFADARRSVMLPILALDQGPWSVDQLSEVRSVHGKARGFFVMAGAIGIELGIAGQVSTRMIVPRELVLLDGGVDQSIDVQISWTVFDPATLIVLDRRLAIIAIRWPGLMDAIFKRAAQQVRHATLQQAISQLPRVEDRLLALLWSIADRQGVVRGDGVWVHLPVTHAMLARMIGARRPTVSLGLRALSDQGLATAEGTGWLISFDSLGEFRPDGSSEPAEQPEPL